MAKHVFILDDMPLLCRMYSEVLQRHGYTTQIVTSSNEAWDKLQGDKLHDDKPQGNDNGDGGETPDCFVFDVLVPGTFSGIELCRRLRASPRFARTPIVILTASSAVEIQQDAWAAGCDAFFSKPCKLDALVEVIDALTSVSTPPPAA